MSPHSSKPDARPLAPSAHPAWGTAGQETGVRALALLLLAALACSLPYTSTAPDGLASAGAATLAAVPSPTPVPTLPPTPAYQPVFEPADCSFELPSGSHPQCGYL